MLIIFLHWFYHADAQPHYRLIANDTVRCYNLIPSNVFDLTAAGIGSKYSVEGYIVGTARLTHDFQILRISFSKDLTKKPKEDYYFIPIPDKILENSNRAIIIASLFETRKGTLTFLVNRRYWITVCINGSEAKIKSIVDVCGKTGYGFRYLFSHGNTIVGFKELNIGETCIDKNQPDTAKLFIFNKKFKLLSIIPLPDFETSFLDFLNYRYLDFKDGKLIIISPTRFILTTFNLKNRKLNRLNISELEGFSHLLIDTAIENKIKKDFPGNRYADRGSKIFEIGDSFTFVTKMYINDNKEIRFITASNSKDPSYSLSNIKFVGHYIAYSILDKDLSIYNKFNEKESDFITKEDYIFAPTNINFSKNKNYFFVFGTDNWNANPIDMTYKDYNNLIYDSRTEYKLRYYFLEEYFK